MTISITVHAQESESLYNQKGARARGQRRLRDMRHSRVGSRESFEIREFGDHLLAWWQTLLQSVTIRPWACPCPAIETDVQICAEVRLFAGRQ